MSRTARSLSRRSLLACFVVAWGATAAVACSRPYRVGDRVLVEWGEDKLLYPAFIIQIKGKSRFRVHYEGYPARWDEDVALPRIRGRVEGEVTPPPPPRKVRLARGMDSRKPGELLVSPFKMGDRIRVRWRESIYRAIVLEVISATQLRIHYEGHENAWDEVIHVSRVVTGD